MARNNKPSAPAQQAKNEPVTKPEPNSNAEPTTNEPPTTPLPGIGLGDLMGDGNNEPDLQLGTADRLREITHVSLDPQTLARMQEAMEANVRGPGMDIAVRHSESNPQPQTLPPGPAQPEQLRDKRVTYPAKPAAKCGPTVQSLTKAELGNRTRQDKVLVVCPEHHTACYSGSSVGIYTHFYCPVEGCNFMHKLVTPTVAQKMRESLRRSEQLPHAQQDIQPR